MKLIIAGGRDFSDIKAMKEDLLTIQKDFTITEIVSGMARGADSLAVILAKELNISIKEFPANWSLYGKSAGYKRNVEMAEYATHLLAYWDGSSKGTKHMIDIANLKNIQVCVRKY